MQREICAGFNFYMGGSLGKLKCISANERAGSASHHSSVNLEQDVSLDSEQRNVTKDPESAAAAEENQAQLEEEVPYRTFLLETLNSFRQQGRFTDLIVEVNGKDFPVHRNVLAASCVFFRDFVAKSDKYPVVCSDLAKLEPSTMESLLSLVYTGKCNLDERNASSIHSAAEMLGIQNLLDASKKPLCVAKDSVHGARAGQSCTTLRSHHEESLVEDLNEFQAQGRFCDITVMTASGRVVPAHKNILAAVSCFFQGLIRSEMKEVHESKVDLGVIDEGIVEELLYFIYTGKISITFDNVRSLLQASDYLLIEHLKRKIINFLTSSATVSNVWRLLSLVKTFDCLTEVTVELLHLVCSNFWIIADSEEFLQLTEEDLRWFLSNDDILASETHVLESFIRWYEYDPEHRQKSFMALIPLIHMSSVPHLYLQHLADNAGIDALLSFSGYQLQSDVSVEDVKRTSHFHNMALFGLTHRLNYSYNLCYWLPFAGPWSLVTRIPHNKSMWANGTPIMYTNNALFVQIPWYDPKLAFYENPLGVRHLLSASVLATTSVTEPPTPMTFDCASVGMGGCIYLIGGITVQEVHKTVQRYDIHKKTWESVADMRERRYELTAVNYKDKHIYVFGGIDGSGNKDYIKTVEKYDARTDTWSYVAPMRHARSSAFAFVHNDRIYVIGGEGTEGGRAPDCEVYNPLTNEWRVTRIQVNKMYTLRGHADAGSFVNLGCVDGAADNGGDVNFVASDTDRLGLRFAAPKDPSNYDEATVTRPYVTCINGKIIVLDFSTCCDGQRKAKFYFVDPESGNFRVLQSLSFWPSDISYGAIVPLSRGDMLKALRDPPGNSS